VVDVLSLRVHHSSTDTDFVLYAKIQLVNFFVIFNLDLCDIAF